MSIVPYRPPVYRRALPWLFVAMFFCLAPLLVLYTAGYRYNGNKKSLERNGTLILDTTPKGAAVRLDQETLPDTTPTTLQNIAPGWHTIKLERTGYQPWTKRLLIRAEQATFADHIWLWKQTSPQFTPQAAWPTASSTVDQTISAYVNTEPLPLPAGKWKSNWLNHTVLLSDAHEIWIWSPGMPAAELVWRQSAPLVTAVWHRSGRSIFVATEQDVFAIELDERDGYLVTPLAHFDQIRALAMFERRLYMNATQGQTDGVWQLDVE